MSGFERGSGRSSPRGRAGYGIGERGGYRGYVDYRGGMGRSERGGYRGRASEISRNRGGRVGERGGYTGTGERGGYRGVLPDAERGDPSGRGNVATAMRSPPLEPYLHVETFLLPLPEPLGPQHLAQTHSAVSLSSDTVILPIRPGLGTKGGRSVILLTNHCRTSLWPGGRLLQYDVAFAETSGTIIPRLPPHKARQVLGSALEQNRTSIGDVAMAFDGRKSLFTRDTQALGRQRTITGRCPRPGGAQKKEKRNVEEGAALLVDVYHVVLTLAGELSLGEVDRCVDQRDLDANPRPCLTALETVLREEALRTCIELGPSTFLRTDKPSSPVFVNDLFVAHRGYFQGLHLSQAGLTYKVDHAMVLFIREQPLPDLIARFLKRSAPLEVLEEHDARTLTKLLRGLRVEATHRPGHVYTVRGLSSLPAQRLTVLDHDSQTEQTVYTFFRGKYGKELRFPNLLCVRVGAKQRLTYLPPEVCKIIAGQRVPLSLVPDVAEEVAQLGTLPPSNLFNQIVLHGRYFRDSATGLAKSFGLELLPQVVKVQGRILDSPKVCMQGVNRQLITEQAQGGSWALTRKLFFRPASVTKWAVCNLCTRERLPDQDVRGLVDDLLGILDRAGVQALRPLKLCMASDHPHSPEALLRHVYEEMGRDTQLVLCIIEKEGDVYDRIKRTAEVELGLLTQCLRIDNARQRDPLTLFNLCHKMNSKLGGYTSVLDKSHLQYVSHGSSVVMGAALLSPHPLSRAPAYASLTASMDERVHKHTASVRAQDPGAQHIQDMQAMATPLLRGFSQRNRSLPGRIILYRIGLKEAHYETVLQAEVRALQAACHSIRSDYSPPITYLAVSRDHKTRFFATDVRDQDSRTGNVKPGLVVDSGITHPTGYDFYLTPHVSPLGTARPTYYRVLRDESDMPVDTLQQLTYHLCHNGARAARALSVVPSVHYAKLAAKRAHIFLDQVATAEGPTESDQTGQGMDWQSKMQPLKEPLDQTMWFL